MAKISSTTFKPKVSQPGAGVGQSPLSEGLLNVKKKVITVDALTRHRIKRKEKQQAQLRKEQEKKRRTKAEDKLEKKPKEKDLKKKSLKLPGGGFLDKVKNFIGKIILGYFAIRLIDHAPKLLGFLKVAAVATDFIIDWGGKVFDGLVFFLDESYKMYDGLKVKVEDLFGQEGVKQLEDFAASFKKVANYTLITAMAFGGFGEAAAAAQKALVKNVARPVAAAAVKGIARFVGKGAARIVLKGLKLASPIFKKIPIIGPLINFAISYFILKEPIGKAAFRAIGSALFTALGAVIGGPLAPFTAFGGSVLGDWAGGALYDGLFGKKAEPNPFESDDAPEGSAMTPGAESSPTAYVAPSSSGPGIRNQSKGSKMAGELGRYLDAAGVGGFGSGVHQHPEHPPWPRESGHRPGSLHYESQGGRAIDIGGYGPNLFRRQGLSGVDDQTQIIQAIMEWEKQNGLTAKDRAEFAYEGNDPIGHADHVHIAYRKGGVVPKDLYALLHKGEIVVDPDSAGPAKQMLLAINEADSYESIVKAIGDYAPYDALSPQTIVMSQPGSGSQQMYNRGEGSVSYLPVPSAGATSSPKDILYKGA